MRNNTLTHRERVRLSLEHKDTDRIPIAMVCSGINQPTRGEFEEYLRKNRGITVKQFLRPILDIKMVYPPYIGPPLKENTDFWGVRRKLVSFGAGAYNEIDYYPMAEIKDIKELEEYPWPKAEWFDYTNLPEQIKRVNEEEEFCLMSGWGNIFETSWFMRGFEQAFIDMIESPEILHFIMEKVMDFHMEHTRRILEAGMGEIDLIFTADDIGSQQGLLMSLGMWEKYIKPYHVKLNDMIHDYDTKVIYHTDGAVMDAVSGLIDMGIDILQALQFDASGMDPKALKNAYGDRLGFEGGVSVQKTLPFGTSDDVRQETQALMSILGKGGGYILGPSHVIQAGTPVENILAMFETAVHSKE